MYREIYCRQDKLLRARDDGRLKDAKREQKELDPKVEESLKEKPDNADLLNLAAYHKKNAFQAQGIPAL